MLKLAVVAVSLAVLAGVALAQFSSSSGGLSLALYARSLFPGTGTPEVRSIGSAEPEGQPHHVSAPTSVGGNADTTTIEADRYGQFQTDLIINGRSLPALVDTGASYVTLTNDAAVSIGLHLPDSEFKFALHTANGMSRAAAIVIPVVRVGNVEVRNVQAVVSLPGALTGRSLLGMSFLRKLGGFETGGNRLVLKQEH